jgi:hypothetical protein
MDGLARHQTVEVRLAGAHIARSASLTSRGLTSRSS